TQSVEFSIEKCSTIQGRQESARRPIRNQMADRDMTPFLSSLASYAGDPFRLLVESVVEYAIFLLEPSGRVASWNTGAERIFGYWPEEIIGRHVSCFYTSEEVALGEPRQTLQRALDGGSST